MAYFLKHKSVANVEPPADSFNNYGGIDWKIDNVKVLIGIYATRQSAVDALDGDKNRRTDDPAFTFTPDNWKVVYICTDYDRRQWRYREERRFTREEYKPVPWLKLVGTFTTRENSYTVHLDTIEDLAHRDQDSDRYAHLSIKTPGKIAYTENDEHGFNDRQTATTSARYLKKFFPDINLPQIAVDAFVAAVTAGTQPPELKIARDADTCEAVYRCGPSSCMGPDPEHGGEKDFDVWPTRVYGDSDLGIAYIGDPANRVTARGIVWPDKQQYGRLYGDTYKLEIALNAAGYTEGSMNGARIRKIDHPSKPGAIVIPYIDNVSGAEDTGDGYLTLGDGDINTSETCGYTFVSGSRGATCQRCEDWFDGDPDEDNYCPSCERHRMTCHGCNEDIWSDDDGVMINVGYYGYDYCESCYSNDAETCPSCEDIYVPEADHAGRSGHRSTCRTCHDNGLHPCGDCGTYVDADVDYCEDCIGDHADDDDDQGDDTSSIDPVTVAEALVSPDAPGVRIIDPDNCETYTGRWYTLVVLHPTSNAVVRFARPANSYQQQVAQSHGYIATELVSRRDEMSQRHPDGRYEIVETFEPIPTASLPAYIVDAIRGTR